MPNQIVNINTLAFNEAVLVKPISKLNGFNHGVQREHSIDYISGENFVYTNDCNIISDNRLKNNLINDIIDVKRLFPDLVIDDTIKNSYLIGSTYNIFNYTTDGKFFDMLDNYNLDIINNTTNFNNGYYPDIELMSERYPKIIIKLNSRSEDIDRVSRITNFINKSLLSNTNVSSQSQMYTRLKNYKTTFNDDIGIVCKFKLTVVGSTIGSSSVITKEIYTKKNIQINTMSVVDFSKDLAEFTSYTLSIRLMELDCSIINLYKDLSNNRSQYTVDSMTNVKLDSFLHTVDITRNRLVLDSISLRAFVNNSYINKSIGIPDDYCITEMIIPIETYRIITTSLNNIDSRGSIKVSHNEPDLGSIGGVTRWGQYTIWARNYVDINGHGSFTENVNQTTDPQRRSEIEDIVYGNRQKKYSYFNV